jgi:predicted TIM-barrel fold metal-dependent hydrolase
MLRTPERTLDQETVSGSAASRASTWAAARFIWASDFPHNDAKYPGDVDELREHNGDLPHDERIGLFGANALDLYGLPNPFAAER